MPRENPVRMKGTMMAFKNTCRTLAKTPCDEPIFVLRAQDELAPDLVRLWAVRAKNRAEISDEKYAEAMTCADAMQAWPTRKLPD